MQRSNPFARARALFAAIALAATRHATPAQLAAANTPYVSRGKGEGHIGNKHAKSSFKQNKRRGL